MASATETTPAPTGYGYITAEEASETVFNGKLTPKTIRHLATQGILPSVRAGHKIFFSPAALAEWAANGGRGYHEQPRPSRKRARRA